MTDLLRKGRAPILDGRLSAAVRLAGNPRVFADIGADHGRLSAVLLWEDAKRHALVADISAAALQKAKDRLGRMALAERAVFAVANGLDALDAMETAPDTIFVLGMGGDTVSGIIQRGAGKLRGSVLILGAQTELPLVRQTLCDAGYRIRQEIIASENERDYILIRAEQAASDEPVYGEEELLLGPGLLKSCPPNWKPVLIRRKRLLTQAIEAMEAAERSKDMERLALCRREIGYVNAALSRLEMQEG